MPTDHPDSAFDESAATRPGEAAPAAGAESGVDHDPELATVPEFDPAVVPPAESAAESDPEAELATLSDSPADPELVTAPDLAPPEAAAPELAPAAYVPRPKLPIVPERGEDGLYRTDGIHIERTGGRACFIVLNPAQPGAQRIFVPAHSFARLVAIATANVWDTGKLWRALCDIPLERPLPNRRLEEELRALLSTFALDFQQ